MKCYNRYVPSWLRGPLHQGKDVRWKSSGCFPSQRVYLEAFPEHIAFVLHLSMLTSFTDHGFLFVQGTLVAVGTHKGFVQIWDAAAGKKLSMLEGHTARVGKEVGGGDSCMFSFWISFAFLLAGIC